MPVAKNEEKLQKNEKLENFRNFSKVKISQILTWKLSGEVKGDVAAMWGPPSKPQVN